MPHGALTALTLAAALCCCSTAGRLVAPAAQAQPVSYRFEVQQTLPHVGKPFTQGLEFFDDGRLVETSGSYPPGTPSYVRIVNASTGETLMHTKTGLSYRFVEGIVQLQRPSGNWFASTYQDHVVVEWDPTLSHVVKEHPFPYTGWGFTRSPDGQAFLATNGSAYIMRIDAQHFGIQDSLPAMCLGQQVSGLNELEMVDDFLGLGPMLLGNVYQTRLVLALNPTTMHCVGALNLKGLGTYKMTESWGFAVANGVAFNRHTGNFVVTGKNWPSMYEISLHQDAAETALSMLEDHLSKR